MLPLFGLFLFAPLLIGSIVAGIARNKWLRLAMSLFAFSPIIVGTVLTEWKTPWDKDLLIIWGAYIVLHLVIRFISRRLSQRLNRSILHFLGQTDNFDGSIAFQVSYEPDKGLIERNTCRSVVQRIIGRWFILCFSQAD